MFQKLSKRFTRILFVTVFSLSLISCLTIGSYTSYIALSDFQEKILHVCKYYSNRLTNKLNAISETTNFVTTQGIFDMTKAGESASEISERLRNMTLGNNNIIGATIVTSHTVNNARDAKIRLTDNFGNNYRKTLEKYKQDIWITGTSGSDGTKDSLLYVIPAADGDYLILSATVDNLFWDFDHSANLFLKKSDIYILDKDGTEIAIYKGSGKRSSLKYLKGKQKSNAEYVVENNNICYFYRIPNSEATLAIYIPKIYNAAQLYLLAILFVLIFMAVGAELTIALRIFVHNITYPLETICNEMVRHRENYKKTAEKELHRKERGKS